MSTAGRAKKSSSRATHRSPQSSPPPRIAMRPPPPRASDDDAYARDHVDEATANQFDEADFESLIRRASSRPPRPLDSVDPLFDLGISALEAPSSLAIALDGSKSGIREISPLGSTQFEPNEESRPSRWMVLVPWSLLGVGAIAAAVAWPGASIDSATGPIATDLAPIAAPTDNPSKADSVASTSPRAPLAVETETGVADRRTRTERDERTRTSSETRTRDRSGVAAPASAPHSLAASTATNVPTTSEVTHVETTTPAAAAPPDVLGRMSDLLGSRPTVTTNAVAVPVVDATPDRPSRAEVASALRGVRASVDACTAQAGSVSIRITVASDGSVTSAAATGAFAGTSEGACMANVVRSARFPAFRSGPMSIVFPFVLRGP